MDHIHTLTKYNFHITNCYTIHSILYNSFSFSLKIAGISFFSFFSIFTFWQKGPRLWPLLLVIIFNLLSYTGHLQWDSKQMNKTIMIIHKHVNGLRSDIYISQPRVRRKREEKEGFRSSRKPKKKLDRNGNWSTITVLNLQIKPMRKRTTITQTLTPNLSNMNEYIKFQIL